jgi:hypothetical protein
VWKNRGWLRWPAQSSTQNKHPPSPFVSQATPPCLCRRLFGWNTVSVLADYAAGTVSELPASAVMVGPPMLTQVHEPKARQ